MLSLLGQLADRKPILRPLSADIFQTEPAGATTLPIKPAGNTAPAGRPEEITFGNLLEWYELFWRGKHCRREVHLNRSDLQRRFGKQQSILALAPKMRCKRCKNAAGNTIKIGKERR